jgi:hypothetical protein
MIDNPWEYGWWALGILLFLFIVGTCIGPDPAAAQKPYDYGCEYYPEACEVEAEYYEP